MKPRKFVKLFDSAMVFVDIFGDNYQTTKLSEIVRLSTTKDGKITIKNIYGTTKSFQFEEENFHQIMDEIASCVEAFKPKYPGHVLVHNGSFAGKLVVTISTKLWLDGTNSFRERSAIISIQGKKATTKFSISETFVA